MTASTTMTSITISPKLNYQQHRIDEDCINNIVRINIHADNTGSNLIDDNLIDFDRLDEDTINTIVESTIASTKDDDCIDDDINQDIVASTFTTTTT